MSKGDFHHKLNRTSEITLSVKGRKSGKAILRPVWFAYDDNILYLMPNYGSNTNGYKNFLANQKLKISVNDQEIPARGGKPITDSHKVRDIMSNVFQVWRGKKVLSKTGCSR
jgi:hypothetical protein